MSAALRASDPRGRALTSRAYSVPYFRRVAQSAERPDTSSCPPALRTLLEACWRQVPSQRPTFEELQALPIERLCVDDAAEMQMRLLLASKLRGGQKGTAPVTAGAERIG